MKYGVVDDRKDEERTRGTLSTAVISKTCCIV